MRLVQRSFAGGELGPSLWARDDLVKYESGGALFRNFLPLVHGAAANRAGFEFLAEVKTSAKATRLIPFAFSTTQTYVLEFGDLYMRVYKREGGASGRVLVPAPVAAWNIATPYVVGDHVLQGGVVYYCILANTGNAPPNATFWYPLAGGALTAIVEIPTPYLEADLARLKFFQSHDTMTLTHPSYDDRELVRTAHHVWKLAATVYGPSIAAPVISSVAGSGAGNDVGYIVTAVHAETFEESVPSAPVVAVNINLGALVTVTWGAVTGAGKYHVYRKALFPTSGATKRAEAIYSFVGTSDGLTFTEIPESTSSASGENPPTTRTPFAGAGNKPAAGAYFEQRRVTGGSLNRPAGLDFSQTGNFKNYNVSTPLRADDAIARVLGSLQANEIRHLVPLEQLIVLTSGGEWVVRGTDGAISPLDFEARQQGYGGSSHVRPVVVKDTVILVQERGSIVRDLFFQLEADKYRGNDLSILAQHLFTGHTIVDMDYAQVPDSVLWLVREDGILLSLSYNREHQVWAWAQHATDGLFESVAVIAEGSEDGVYVVVRRKINGAWVRYVERLHSRRFLGDVRDAFFIDSGLSLDVPLTITGATAADPIVLTSAAHGLANGDPVDIDDLVSVAPVPETQETLADLLNRGRFVVANAAANTFELVGEYDGLPVNGAGLAAYDSGGTVRKAVATVSVPHLVGKTVTGLFNGNELPPVIVPGGGTVTLPKAASRVHVGLGYTCDLETLDLSLVGLLQGVRDFRKVVAVRLQVEESRGGSIGTSLVGTPGRLYPIKWRDGEGYNEETGLLTGFVKTGIESKWDERGRVFLRQDTPLPLTVLSLGLEFEAAVETRPRRAA